ncbi:uncharacterized protein LOC113008246 [Tachysurus ichikawai]
MSSGGRKSLVWDIRKSLLTLTAEELLRVARAVNPVSSTLSHCDQVAQLLPQSPCVAKARAVASLIGKKALAQSYLNGLAVFAGLWIPREEELKVTAANGSLIPYDGWVAMTVYLPGNLDLNLSISVPFLISSYPMDKPLIGFNVLEVLICGKPERLVQVLAGLLSNAISVPKETAEALVNFIQTAKPVMQQGRLRTDAKYIVLPAGQVSWVRCRVPPNMDASTRLVLLETDEDSLPSGQWDTGPGLFEIQNPIKPYVTIPIGNNTNHDLTIPRKTALGILQGVENVVKADILDKTQPAATVSQITTTQVNHSDPPLWDPPVNLDHLEEEQQEVARKMLHDESNAFARDGDDLGSFQRSMEEMLGSLRDEYCIPYLDELLCYSRSFSDHVEVIHKVLQALQHHGVKLRAEKCEMFQKEVRYVGRLVSAEGVRIDPKDPLKTKTPQTVGDLRRVLGFLSYYRSYIQDFARLPS